VLQSHFSLHISARHFEIAPRSPRTGLARRDRVAILPRGRSLDAIFGNLAEMVVISPRSRRSWRDLAPGYFSRRDILKSRRDRGYLAEISPISARSRRGLLFSARYFEISPRSWLSPARSRRDCRDLAEIAVKFLQGLANISTDQRR